MFRSPLSSNAYGAKAQRSRVVKRTTMKELGLDVTLPLNFGLDLGLKCEALLRSAVLDMDSS